MRNEGLGPFRPVPARARAPYKPHKQKRIYIPNAGLTVFGNVLYGTTISGGSSGYYGTLFSLSLPPQLTAFRSAADLVLIWPTNSSGFTLQSTTNLGSSAVWSTNSPVPVVVNGQNAVTNPISGAQQFYRLAQ
jgi:hypothetical protein